MRWGTVRAEEQDLLSVARIRLVKAVLALGGVPRDDHADGALQESDRLLEWYAYPEEDERDRSKQAGVRVGEFIERSCDDINIGGIRA